MDTDDLSEAAYDIIRDALQVNGLLGAQLAVSGHHARSETEFLRCMLETLAEAGDCLEDYLGDDEANADAEQGMTNAIGRLEKSVRALLIQPVEVRKPRTASLPKHRRNCKAAISPSSTSTRASTTALPPKPTSSASCA